MDDRNQAVGEQVPTDPMFKSRIIEAIRREVAAGTGEQGAAHMRGRVMLAGSDSPTECDSTEEKAT